MLTNLILSQLLNGLQYGMLLFLLAAGLTLVLGIMSYVNVAHGSLYMVGAYCGAAAYGVTSSFGMALLAAVVGAAAVGFVIEKLIASKLYRRDHVDHVLASFGLILLLNELARIIWGPLPLFMSAPAALSGTISVLGIQYSAYRFAIIALGVVVVVAAHYLINGTRAGMLVRAGASNAPIVSALGVNIKLLNAALFTLGAALAGLVGGVAAPIVSVQLGMGEEILILTLVVIVVGGIGSIRGSFYAALIIGVIDTLGRTLIPLFLRETMTRDLANAAGPATASMLVYVAMAIILAIRPQGLFPVRGHK